MLETLYINTFKSTHCHLKIRMFLVGTVLYAIFSLNLEENRPQ